MSVERGAERARLIAVDDAEQRITCVLAGLLPDGHIFELKLEAGDAVVRGKVDPAISSVEFAEISRRWLFQPAVAVVTARRVLKGGEAVRTSYTLLRLEPPQTDMPATLD